MKKLGLMFLSIALLLSFCALPFGVNAQTAENTERIISETVEMLEDGYYVKTIVAEEIPAMAPRATTTKSGSKAFVLYSNSDEELARFTLKGTFSVNSGVSATCTASSYTTSISNNSWSVKSASATKSGNQAIGDVTFVKKVLFITTSTKEAHVVLTCDKNGNLS